MSVNTKLLNIIIEEGVSGGFDDVHISKLAAEELEPEEWKATLRQHSYEEDREGWHAAQVQLGSKYLEAIKKRRTELEQGGQDLIVG